MLKGGKFPQSQSSGRRQGITGVRGLWWLVPARAETILVTFSKVGNQELGTVVGSKPISATQRSVTLLDKAESRGRRPRIMIGVLDESRRGPKPFRVTYLHSPPRSNLEWEGAPSVRVRTPQSQYTCGAPEIRELAEKELQVGSKPGSHLLASEPRYQTHER